MTRQRSRLAELLHTRRFSVAIFGIGRVQTCVSTGRQAIAAFKCIPGVNSVFPLNVANDRKHHEIRFFAVCDDLLPV